MKKHIAVVAPIGAGKTTLAKYFQSKDFKLYKLTYAIYDECDRLGIDREDRTTLQDIGDKLRDDLGLDGLAKLTIKEVKTVGGRFIIDSIRNHNELKRLMENFGGDILVVAITAPLKVRYRRIVGRKGQYREDKKTLKEFKIDNDRDLGVGNAENEQNVQKCIDMAQIEIDNSGTEGEFIEKLDLLFEEHFGDS